MKFYILLNLFFILINQNLKAQTNYSILDFGAFNDTAKLSTSAINKAISQCHLKGGGRVVIPAGKYKSGTIVLKDNVELYLERGATLYASTNPKDFPQFLFRNIPSYELEKNIEPTIN